VPEALHLVLERIQLKREKTILVWRLNAVKCAGAGGFDGFCWFTYNRRINFA